MQDQIPSTTSDLTMSIAAAHRHVCAASVRTRGSRAIKWESVAALLTAAYGHGAERLGELSHAMCGRSITADSGDQLLMLDSPGAPGPRIRSFSTLCAYVQRYRTLVFKSVTFWITYRVPAKKCPPTEGTQRTLETLSNDPPQTKAQIAAQGLKNP